MSSSSINTCHVKSDKKNYLNDYVFSCQEHTFVMRISHFSQIYSPTKLVLRSTKAQLDIGLDAVTKWCVLLYPNGNQPERAGFVSLYLYR